MPTQLHKYVVRVYKEQFVCLLAFPEDPSINTSEKLKTIIHSIGFHS